MGEFGTFLLSLISIGAIATILINTLRYVFLPHYRLEINRKRHNDDAEAMLNYYGNVYKKNNLEKRSKFELQKLTNAAFGTKNFNFELIFLLFERDVRDVEFFAKEIQKRWLLIKVDYENNKIISRISTKIIPPLTVFLLILYFSFSAIILGISMGYEWFLLKSFNGSIVVTVSFISILLVAYLIYVLASIKAMKRLID